ncbi:MAG: peptide-methionine (S)-S-oxide reductase MsrA [Pseudomonadales bacterium]|nr:peptide-methionine (S)-S-oxide reductase MsrA [Pseudomonadales bacterium]
MGFLNRSPAMPTPENALPGRSETMPVAEKHFVNQAPMMAPFPDNMQQAMFGMGCFWGAERKFWQFEGIFSTAVGYSAGLTPNPSYEEVCSGRTGHNEVVLVIFDPAKVSYNQLLALFWEGHNPTQGMQQGGDIGTQYRSGIYTFSSEQLALAQTSLNIFQSNLQTSGLGEITTEIIAADKFYYAEDYHQQYLAKVPHGYCGLGGTGVCYNPADK